MKEKIYIGSSLEEVEALAIKELGVSKENLYFDVLSDDQITRDEVQVHVMVDANPVKIAKDYIENYLHNVGVSAFVERRMRDNVIEFGVNSATDNSLLIGKNSKNLIALQMLTTFVANQFFDQATETGLVIKVDIGDYRRQRDESLERLATRIARDVARTKIPVRLRPMNSYERRIIHDKLSTWRDVTTFSEGVEPNRCLVVSPKENNRPVKVEEPKENKPETNTENE